MRIDRFYLDLNNIGLESKTFRRDRFRLYEHRPERHHWPNISPTSILFRAECRHFCRHKRPIAFVVSGRRVLSPALLEHQPLAFVEQRMV